MVLLAKISCQMFGRCGEWEAAMHQSEHAGFVRVVTPVSRAARLGEQVGAAQWALENSRESAASLSEMGGVDAVAVWGDPASEVVSVEVENVHEEEVRIQDSGVRIENV